MRKADKPYHLPVLLSRNLGSLTSWNPLGHSRPVMGLIYLYLYEWQKCSVYITTLQNKITFSEIHLQVPCTILMTAGQKETLRITYG